jgi:hypothetical protein
MAQFSESGNPNGSRETDYEKERAAGRNAPARPRGHASGAANPLGSQSWADCGVWLARAAIAVEARAEELQRLGPD